MSEPQPPAASDANQKDAQQKAGGVLLGLMQSLARTLILYDANNSAVQRIFEMLNTTLAEYAEAGGGALRLQLVDDEVFVNGRLLKMDESLYDRAADLSKRLEPLDISDFVFGVGLTGEDLTRFVEDLSASLRTNISELKPDSYGALKVAKAKGSSIASFRFQPDRLAIWLYSSLLDLVERLYEEHREGRAPSLLQLRRTLQLVIDNMRTHSAIFHLLAAVQDPSQAPTLERARVALTIELVGFASWVGLPASERMTLSLAGILGGLTSKGRPDTALSVLARFSGLGEAALPLALMLHDAQAARRGNKVELPGLILGMVEEYVFHTTATPDREARSPNRILRGMQSGAVTWVPKAMGAAFAAFKGPYPLGSLVTLSTSETAVVVGLGPGKAGKATPAVAVIQKSGALGQRIDLATTSGVTITGAPEPGKTGVRVAILKPS
jgi:hypothetical protein